MRNADVGAVGNLPVPVALSAEQLLDAGVQVEPAGTGVERVRGHGRVLHAG